MKNTLFLLLVLLGNYRALAQLDTTSFPKERQEIRNLIHQRKPNASIDCADFIAVGPKGDISFSHQQWQGVQAKEKVIFKSVQVVPGHELIRIYEGTMAVINFLANVHLTVDTKDVHIKIRRLEVYHKTASGWCRVAGQGTEVDEKLFPVMPASK